MVQSLTEDERELLEEAVQSFHDATLIEYCERANAARNLRDLQATIPVDTKVVEQDLKRLSLKLHSIVLLENALNMG